MEQRPWKQHLRLLPGGDSDVASAIIATGLLYLCLAAVGCLFAYLLLRGNMVDSGPFTWFPVGNTLPCAVIALWTGLRVRNSKHIGLDEAAADLKRRRVFYGDEVTRVPNDAFVFSIKPRQITTAMADGRRFTLFFRVNSDPEDLLALGKLMRAKEGLTVEDYVHSLIVESVAEMLPDPQGIREALTGQLLKRGIVITRVETD